MNFTHHEQTPRPEHPFAEYIRILGKGKKGSRPLTQDEAYQAMKMILAERSAANSVGCIFNVNAR